MDPLSLLVDLLVIVLAAGAVVDVWFNGDLFAKYRAYFEASVDYDVDPEDDAAPEYRRAATCPLWMHCLNRWCPRWVCHMLTCSYCMPFHVTLWATVYWLGSLWLASPWAVAYKFPLYWLAVTRAAYIVNASLAKKARYDRDLHATPSNLDGPPRLSHWDDDKEFPVEDWRHEVAEDNTRQSYAEWCRSQREAKDVDPPEGGN